MDDSLQQIRLKPGHTCMGRDGNDFRHLGLTLSLDSHSVEILTQSFATRMTTILSVVVSWLLEGLERAALRVPLWAGYDGNERC